MPKTGLMKSISPLPRQIVKTLIKFHQKAGYRTLGNKEVKSKTDCRGGGGGPPPIPPSLKCLPFNPRVSILEVLFLLVST